LNRKEVLIDFFKYTQKAGVSHEGLGADRIIDDYIKSKGIELLDLVTLLEILPSKIRDKQEELGKKTDEKNLFEYMNKSRESEISFQVSSEKILDGDKKGKEKYTSKDKRDKATKTRLNSDDKYKENKKNIINLYKEIKEIEISIDFLRYSHRSAIGKTRLMGRE